MYLRNMFIVVFCCFAIAGCKVELVVPNGGGTIRSESYAYQCRFRSSTCTIDVSDIYFDETFVGDPAKDYVFEGWRKRSRGFCGGNAKPCYLTTTGFAPYEALMALLENPNGAFYLEAIFTHKDDVGAKTINVTGLWNYTEKCSSAGAVCTARGQWLQEVVVGEGHYVTLQPGSNKLLSLSGCERATVTTARPSLFVRITDEEVVTARQIAYWQSSVHRVVIHSPDKYTTYFNFARDGILIQGSQTYSRVQ